MQDDRLRLADGRRLAWLRVGDPRGRPVLHCHGGLSCRLEISFADELCRQLGLQWIAVDRPGIGGSDAAPGAGMTDFADDMAALMDALALESAAISGWSAGGPWALVCAARRPERFNQVITLAGMAPLRGQADIAALGMATDRLLFTEGATAQRLARAWLNAARHTPEALLRLATRRMLRAGPDAFALSAETPRGVAACLKQALSPGVDGTLRDYRLLRRPHWPLSGLRAPVLIWHGERDELLPFNHAERLAALVPGAHLYTLEGGHFLPHRFLERVFRTSIGVKNGSRRSRDKAGRGGLN